MTELTKLTKREIIDDFAEEIKVARREAKPPEETVIDFRNERNDGKPRLIYAVPIGLLRFRKDNGRISSDVLHYEKSHGLLDEKTKEAQRKIATFLEEKDKEKTKELMNSIEKSGQREPAIITCDGFLINGNRRKMVMEKLKEMHPGDPRFTEMRVIILPGKNDEGGPPTLLEIEEIENRYQLQSEGKAEYYSFDKALSVRRKMAIGMSLKAQLRDDPNYVALEEKDFKKAVKKFEDDFLKPLKCIDRYLEHLERDGLYSTVSSGLGDPEGRWQAFADYYNFVYKKLDDEKTRCKLGILENEIGKIEDVAFKIIRGRQFKNLPKLHMLMRSLPKWILNKESKKELLKIGEIPVKLPKEDIIDRDDKEYDERAIDKIWGKKNTEKIIQHIRKSMDHTEYKKEKETPLILLKTALEKLQHEDLIPENIAAKDFEEAMRIAREIGETAKDLERTFYHLNKGYDKDLNALKDKYKH
jgi:hypothetical protein